MTHYAVCVASVDSMEIQKVLVLIPEHYWDMDQQDMCGEGNENVISQTEKGYECSYIPYTMH